MFKLAHQSQSIFGVFKTALIAYKETFIQILPFYFILTFAQSVTAILFGEVSQNVMFEVTPNFIFQMFCDLVNLILEVIVVYKIISLLFEEKNLNFWVTMKNGLKRFFPYIGVLLLLVLIMSPVALLFLPVFSKQLFGQDFGPILNMLVYIVGLLYFIIAAFMFMPKLYPSLFLICIPKKGIIEAFKESWHLMSGNNLRAIFYVIIIFGYAGVLTKIYSTYVLTSNIPTLILGSAIYIFLLQPVNFVWVVVIDDFRQRQ